MRSSLLSRTRYVRLSAVLALQTVCNHNTPVHSAVCLTLREALTSAAPYAQIPGVRNAACIALSKAASADMLGWPELFPRICVLLSSDMLSSLHGALRAVELLCEDAPAVLDSAPMRTAGVLDGLVPLLIRNAAPEACGGDATCRRLALSALGSLFPHQPAALTGLLSRA